MPKKDKPPKKTFAADGFKILNVETTVTAQTARGAQIIVHSEVTDTGEVMPTNAPVQGPAPGKIITILQEGGHFQKGDKMRAQAATARDSLLLALQTSLDHPKATEEQRAELARVFSILLDTLETLEIKSDGENVKIDFTLFDNSRKNEVMAAIQSQPVQTIIRHHLLPPLQQTQEEAAALEPEPAPTPGKRTRKRTKEIPETFRRPKALVEQMLLPIRFKQGNQLALFEDLPERMKQGLKQAKPQMFLGIEATPEEERLLTTLSRLLHEKSQTKDRARLDYYTGNRPPVNWPLQLIATTKKGPVKFEQDDTAPVLSLSFYELVQTYQDTLKPTGENYVTVSKLLDTLTKRRFFMRYTAKVNDESTGTTLTATITTNEPLILRLEDVQAKEERAGEVLFEKREIVLTLHPIVKHEISKRYITYPSDIQKRMQEAWGPGRLPVCVSKLRDYILTEQFRGAAEISLLKIYPAIGLGGLIARRKAKEARGQFERAATLWLTLGLLQAWQILPNAAGGEKVVFEINRKWPLEQTNGG